MKKKLFLALVTTLLVLLAASSAAAESPSDYDCYKCGQPCTAWFNVVSSSYDYMLHAPYCRSCNAILRGAETPCTPVESTATCTSPALCSVCGLPDFISSAPNPDAHKLGKWSYRSDEQHVRFCLNCNDYTEYGDHHGGTATCTTPAICEDCGSIYGERSNDHVFSEWMQYTSEQHRKYCSLCWSPETIILEDHYNHSDNSCKPNCEVCGYLFFNPNGEHSMSLWIYDTDEQHTRYCLNCNDYTEYGDHHGEAATCSTRALCTDCEAYYGDKNTDAHEWGNWLPDENGMHVRLCALNGNHMEYAPCSWGSWTSLSDEYHVRECDECGARQVQEHTGGTATCTSPRICETCGEGYGSPDNSGMTGHPNPVIEQKAPTCYDEGYYRVTCDEPGCSMPFFEIIFPSAGQHLYNRWDIQGGGMHHDDCALCGTHTEVSCTLWSLHAGDTLLTVCPVCGDFGDAPFAVLIARDDPEVPVGTLLVRGLDAPVDGVLCAFTVAGVYGGRLAEIHGPVSVTVPVPCEGFTLVRAETAGGAETRTEIPFTLANGMLTFKTDTAGMFLLVPAE